MFTSQLRQWLVAKVVNRQCEVEQEESLLTSTEIELSSEYKSEKKFSAGSTLFSYTSLPSTLLPLFLTLSLIKLPLLYNNMS